MVIIGSNIVKKVVAIILEIPIIPILKKTLRFSGEETKAKVLIVVKTSRRKQQAATRTISFINKQGKIHRTCETTCRGSICARLKVLQWYKQWQ